MPNNYFITGMPKSGKTTLLRKLADRMEANGLKVGGFVSPAEKSHGTRTGFYVQDIDSGKIEQLAAVNVDGPKVAKYHVDIRSFESMVGLILEKIKKYDVVVIDEIGRMEMKSERFGDLLIDLLESDIPLVASLHRDYLEDYKAWGEVFILTPSNRGRLYMELAERVSRIRKRAVKKTKKPILAKKKTKKAKKTKPEKEKKKSRPRRKEEDLDLMADHIILHSKRHHAQEKPSEEVIERRAMEGKK